jgi:hypothetical protein
MRSKFKDEHPFGESIGSRSFHNRAFILCLASNVADRSLEINERLRQRGFARSILTVFQCVFPGLLVDKPPKLSR